MNTLSPPLTGKDLFLADHLRLLQQPVSDAFAWADRLRKLGLDHFVAQGFPTLRDEAWRQTSLAPLLNHSFQSFAGQSATEPAAELAQAFRYANLTGPELLFHNGRLVRMTGLESLPAGVRVLDLAAALESERNLLEPLLGTYADTEHNPFVALNTAFIEQGVVITVPRGVTLDAPIHCLHLASVDGDAWHAHPRMLVVLGEHAQLTLIETWGGDSHAPAYFNNPVSEFSVGEQATLHHVKVQRESLNAIHISNMQYHQARGSQVHSHIITLGGALVRNEVASVLDGEGAHCMLNGLYITAGTQHVDNHTRLDHARPHCTSHEAYKGILDGDSSGVFTGRILVRPDAQKTDAIQRNRALLLTSTATFNSQPQLEIFADDVRCTHGATVGQLSADALFYLRARGIDQAAAQGLLTYAFANEIVDQLPPGPVRDFLEHLLAVHFKIIQDGAGQ